MREDRSNTERDAGEHERAHSTEYDVDMFDPEGMNDPAPEWDDTRLARFLAETEAVYASDWYKKNITSDS